jgi:hypothetical protein
VSAAKRPYKLFFVPRAEAPGPVPTEEQPLEDTAPMEVDPPRDPKERQTVKVRTLRDLELLREHDERRAR